jgi:hypothetical protein
VGAVACRELRAKLQHHETRNMSRLALVVGRKESYPILAHTKTPSTRVQRLVWRRCIVVAWGSSNVFLDGGPITTSSVKLMAEAAEHSTQEPSVPPTRVLVARLEPSFQLITTLLRLRCRHRRLLSALGRQAYFSPPALGHPPATTGRGTAEHTSAQRGRASTTCSPSPAACSETVTLSSSA